MPSADESDKILAFDPSAAQAAETAPRKPDLASTPAGVPAGAGSEAPGAQDRAPGAAQPPAQAPKGPLFMPIAAPVMNEAARKLREDPAGARPWLSLGMIVGQEAHHIGRFLSVFEPLVDEIVIVRAIGRQEADATLQIAMDTVKKPLVVAEYFNEPRFDWKHVDNFAAARQKSFDLTSGNFIMWADCDDVIDADEAKKFRAAVDLGNFDILFMHYRVPGATPLLRERVIRRTLTGWRWCNAVHEAISLPAQFNPLYRTDIEVFHAPLHDGTGKPKGEGGIRRNLRILEESVGPSALAYFYLHRDSMLLNEVESALEWGKLALGTKNLTPAERYKVFFDCATIFLTRADWAQMETFAMNGIRLCPDRRECFAIMAISHIERKNFTTANVWIQLARCILRPQLTPNWLEESWYGWRANLTQSFILRKMRLVAEAEKVEDAAHGGKPFFSLLHATRGRAQKAIQARDIWFSAAMKPELIEHIFAIDADDKETLAELEGFKMVVVEPGGGCVRAWNAAAAASRGRVLIQMSDDWNPPFHWDNQILWRMKDPVEKNKPAVLAISDGHRRDKLLCMAILTRAYYERQRHEKTGEPYLFHPDYLGVYSDNEFTVRAYENGVVIEAPDFVFNHWHPIFVGGDLDRTYAEQNSADRYRHGVEVFNRRNPRYKIELPLPAK